MNVPVETLLDRRARFVEQAREALAGCLADEAMAGDALRAIEAAITRNAVLASDPGTGDDVVEHFAAWLKGIRADQAEAADALQSAETRTREARAVLSASRVALEALPTTPAEAIAPAPAPATEGRVTARNFGDSG